VARPGSAQDRLTGTAAARSSVNIAVITSSTTVACPCSRRCAPRAQPFSHDLHYRRRRGQLTGQPLALRPQPCRIVFPTGRSPGCSMRPSRRRRAPVTASRALVHSRIWDWYRPSPRNTAALLPCGAVLVLGDHTDPVGRGERAPDRTGRRIQCPSRSPDVTGTGKNWTVATQELSPVTALHGGPGSSGVSLQPDREGAAPRSSGAPPRDQIRSPAKGTREQADGPVATASFYV